MAKFPQCPRIDWTWEEKKLVFFSTTVQELNQFKRECYSLKYFENLFQNMLNNECEIQEHNPYTKSFQYWHSVFERKLQSLRGLVSTNNRRHSVSILIDQWCRYMTLTHVCNTPWADAAQVEDQKILPRSNGLSSFGENVILEMNRQSDKEIISEQKLKKHGIIALKEE